MGSGTGSTLPTPRAEPSPSPDVASVIVDALAQAGVREAFGVSGGAMAAMWHAISQGPLRTVHFRHESGAAFAAAEAYFASGRPALVFTTAGPGLTNALTGLVAARDEGAQLVVISASTSSAQRGRFAIQETSTRTLPADLFRDGRPFHFATTIESAAQLPTAMRRVVAGLARREGFVAHLSIPTAMQRATAEPIAIPPMASERVAEPGAADVASCVEALRDGRFAIWLGFGARGAAEEIRALARRMRVPVFCSPRAKGIYPEDDPLFVGVTGLGGHRSVAAALAEARPRRVLVLGSRLGEPTSFWDRRFVMPEGFVHVDLDPEIPGAAYGDVPTRSIIADIAPLLRAVLAALPERAPGPTQVLPRAVLPPIDPITDTRARVRPEALMDAIQHHVVDGTRSIVLAESGNSFVWTAHRLRFAEPGRYRASTGVGSMGHATTGVVGAALASDAQAFAVVGDGAMLMNNEINTAVQQRARAVWIVLNDARYGMCAQGMATLGLQADASIPEVDFVAFARSQGAEGVRVDHEAELDAAFARALAAAGPFVIDVRIDPEVAAPAADRNRSLAAQQAGEAPSFPRG